MIKHLTIILAFLITLSTPISAEDEDLFKGKSYGSRCQIHGSFRNLLGWMRLGPINGISKICEKYS
jgi:hypothetical protein